ncbi:Polynucleotide 5'-hydroxyl-kinase nol9 [Podochytrium sp. JEL0797]|nr:Polynucleotide 5'-hydroxyl-kinase nol9 [Podochytrium sp. JEL0797]
MKRASPANPFAALRSLKKGRSESPSAAKKSPHKVAAAATKKAEKIEKLVEESLDEQLRESERKVPFVPSSRSNVASDGKGLALLAMQNGETLCFQGSVLVCPLVGSFSVNGYTFAASKQVSTAFAAKEQSDPMPLRFHPCFSPKSNSFLVMEAVKSSSPLAKKRKNVPTDDDSLNPDSEMNEDEVEPEAIMDALKYLYSRLGKLGKSATTVIALKSMEYSGINVIEKRVPVFKELMTLVPLSELNRDDTFRIPGFEPVIEPNHPHPTLEIDSTWSSIGKEVNLFTSTPIVCVVGSKGLGKSTLSRFMVNQLLSKYPKVAFLDCDLGQPELTVSGQVSLHVLEFPILGPAFTNIKQPLHSCYLGTTSPKNDPDCYTASVSQLWKIYKDQFASTVPLVINTDGWVKGMGFDLLLHSLREIRPTHLIQLGLPPTSPLSASKNIRDDFSHLLNDPETTTTTTVQVHHALGYDETSTSRPSKFNASDMRNLAMIAYFAQTKANPAEPVWISRVHQGLGRCWNFGTSVAEKVPFGVAWKAVRVRFLNVEVPTSQSLIALNGSLVGLISDSLTYTSATDAPPTDKDYTDLTVVPSDLQLPPQTQNCVGLGIVRGIDPVEKCFYVVTPVHGDQLARVNLLVRGAGAEFPVSMMMDGFENQRTNVPYITYTVAEGVGGMAKKIRTNLQRRKHT